MKKSLIVLIAMAFVLALSLPALADVDVTGTVSVTKDKEVSEIVSIEKAHYIGVKQLATPTNSAEAAAVKNDVNAANIVTEVPVPAVPPTYDYNEIVEEYTLVDPGHPATPINKNALIDGGSGNDAAGVTGINQSPGSINNQGNAVSVSMTAAGKAFLHAEAAAEKINGGVSSDDLGQTRSNSINATESVRGNKIDAALTGVDGILGVNQAAGSINNQNNAAALAVGADSIAALSEADLGLVNIGNNSFELAVQLTDTITGGALANASGIVGVNQSSGCMNNQANVVAVCAVVSPF